MKQKRKKLGRKLLGFLLTLAMVVGPMPGMGMTALAVDADLELGEGDLESANQSRNLAVDANGVIHIVYQKTDGSIVYTKSTNSGVSFSDDVTVANNGSECEVAVSSNGRVYVAYHNGSKGYVAYSDDGNNFTSVELSGSDGTSIHLATDGDYVYAIQQNGTALYYSSDKGVTYKSHTGWTGYAYSDVHVDTSNHKVIVLKDNPSVVCRVSEDYGETFTEEKPVKCNNEQISVFYSTATVGSGYAYMSGQNGTIYKINYNDATATEKTVNASSVSTGRSLSSDENNNVIVGYVNDDGKVYYQLSTDGGTTFEDGIAVADATSANAAINIKTGDVLFLYSKDGKIMLHREIGVIKGNVNYINDSIEGLEPNTEYMVEVLGDNDTVTATYYISSNETGNIPFIGIDKDGNAYEDLAGKKIKITKAGTSDVSDPIDIEKRPTPEDAEQIIDENYAKPEDVAENEVLTTENSITIHPETGSKAKQSYKIFNADGTEIAGQDWVAVDENGDIVFSGLSEHTEYLIKAIVPATQTKPRSYESEGVKITTMGTIEVTNPTELSFVQDGLEHEFEITTTPADAKKEYSLLPEENYTEEIVKLKDPGRYTVYYKASKDNYRTVYGSFDVEIREAAPADIVAVAKDYNGVYDGKAHSIEIEVVAPQTGAAVSYGTKEGEYTLTANPSYTDVGTYKVFYRVTAEGRNEKTGSADIVIEKADSTVTTAPAAKTLTYNGQAQELVTAGTASGGTMKYAVTTANQEPAAEAYTFDNTSIPAKTAAGTYYVWYMAKGDENHNDSEPKCVTATISAAKATAATVTANNRTYDGTQKPLVTVDDSTLVGGEMQYALGTETEATEQYTTSIPTATNAGTYYVWYKVVGDENYNDSKADCVVAKIGAVISKTVTFKVVNGAWNDETTEEKTVTLIGYEGDTLKLAANQIPAVGNKPGDIYKAGSWDVTPDTETAITADITYTYTYVEKNPISVNVTFKVVNGSWNEGEGDEATKDKTVTLTGHEGDTLKLTADQIPAVGNKPSDIYKAGSWDVAPSTDAGITKDMTYTYTYVAKETAVVTKAPEAKILTYNGQSQELVNAGEVTGGTMLYAFGTDATTEPAAELYKTSIPAGTDAGTYCVWYKVVGDENHTDVATDKVNVTIAKKNLTVTADAKTIIYGDDDAELTYKVTGLVEGDAQDKVVTGAITREAGTEAGTYRITQGTLASENYDITFTEADYTIKKAVQAAPEEQFTSTKSTNAENEDGKISGFDKEKAYQYSSDDGKTWTDVTGKTDVDVKAGTYLIRYAEDKNHESGQTVTITVEAEQQVVPEPEEQAVIINLKYVTQKKNKIQISWTKVKEADGYDVYVDYCGTKSKKAVKTIKKNSITKTSINKINGKKINQKKCFHAYVVAYKMVDGKKVKLAKTVAAHVAGAKRKGYTNPKTLKLTKSSFSIKVGKTAKIKAKVTLADSKKKHISKEHGAKLRYKSSDKKIASIDKNGKIKGIKKGTCTIYVYTINGIMKKAKVTVK